MCLCLCLCVSVCVCACVCECVFVREEERTARQRGGKMSVCATEGLLKNLQVVYSLNESTVCGR